MTWDSGCSSEPGKGTRRLPKGVMDDEFRSLEFPTWERLPADHGMQLGPVLVIPGQEPSFGWSRQAPRNCRNSFHAQ